MLPDSVLRQVLISAVLIGGAFTAAVAQDLFIYPAEGQNAEQQRRDRLECQLWATDQTGFDPTAPAQAGPQSQAQAPQVPLQGPGVPRSTARGAVIGTAGGAIAGNTGRGALVGATTGALMGAGRRAEQQASADWARQQQAAEAERQLLLQYRRQGFNRAVTACMEGRGYTVS